MATAGPASGTPCNRYKSRCGSAPNIQSVMVAELQSFIQDWTQNILFTYCYLYLYRLTLVQLMRYQTQSKIIHGQICTPWILQDMQLLIFFQSSFIPYVSIVPQMVILNEMPKDMFLKGKRKRRSIKCMVGSSAVL